MHLIHFTPEIIDFLRKDFSSEKQYLILHNLKQIMDKYNSIISEDYENNIEKDKYCDVKELRKSSEL